MNMRTADRNLVAMSKQERLAQDAKRAKYEYARAWRMKNRDKVRKYISEYWARQGEGGRQRRNEYAREWRAKNRDKVRQYNETYWLRKAERAAAAEGI